MTCTFDDLRGGLTIDHVIEAVLDGCNQGPDRLWITELWMRPRVQRLRQCARSPVTDEAAEKLRDAVLKRDPLDYVVEWICERPEVTWAEFDRENQDEEVERVSSEGRARYMTRPALKRYRQSPDYGYVNDKCATVWLASAPSQASAPHGGAFVSRLRQITRSAGVDSDGSCSP
jgi:hypothetical protein